jgi:asparagine synthase (glutamine-hydrolysing)
MGYAFTTRSPTRRSSPRVLAVPTWLRGTPYGYKPLLTTALADLLPLPIAARHTKGDFTPDHYLMRLRANGAVLRKLADGRLAERRLVDPDRLRRLLDHAAAGLPVTFSHSEPVLAAEIWLHAVDTTQATARWQPRTSAMERTAS